MNTETSSAIAQCKYSINEICLDLRISLSKTHGRLDVIDDFIWVMDRMINFAMAYTNTAAYPHIKEYERERYEVIKRTERYNYYKFFDYFQQLVDKMNQLTSEVNFYRKQELDDNITELIRNLKRAIMEYSLGDR